MASIARRSNGRWRARVVGPDGKQRSRDFPRKVDAELWAAQQVTRMRDGTWVDPLHSRRTFGGYAEDWLAHQIHHRASTAEVTRSRLHRWVLPTFAERPLAAIARSDVQAWVREISEHLAPRTVEGCYRLLATILRAAVDDRLITTSPCRRIRLPEATAATLRIPTVEELAAVTAVMPEHMRAFVPVGAGTGMRPAELRGLTVGQVDFLRRTVKVDRQMVAVRGGQPEWGPPKTKASTRTVPVPAEVVDRLAAHLAARPGDPIFRRSSGAPWSRQRFGEEWHGWMEAAGVEPFRPHDLRHFYASALIAAGLSVKVVQERLGHTSAQTTLDTYGHLWPDDEERTREAVSGLVARIG